MAPHDSDSSGDEQEEYTETNVLLGYASKEPEDISHLGGRPEWLDPENPPSAALARCKVCRDLMVLLLQLNAELPAQFPGHERRLYVFSCRRKTCRRKEGSIRVVRGVRVAPGSGSSNAAKEEEEKPKQEPTPTPAPPPPSNLGETLFGAKTLASSSSSASPFASANPFSTGNGGSNPFSSSSNPFSSNSSSTPTATTTEAPSNPPPTTDDNTAKKEKEEKGKEQLESLPKTFAETLSLNNPQSQTTTTTTTTTTPPSPPEPWPPSSDQPRPYTTAYLTDADYETLDPTTPAPIPQATIQMDLDNENENDKGGKGGKGGGGKEDRDVFESAMDTTFQRFADRLAQNPEQAIRYEFGGQPLLSSREDAVGLLLSTDDNDDEDNNSNNNSKVQVKGSKGGVSKAKGKGKGRGKGMPRCENCGARRTFEVQLCPQAIAELEADEDVQAQLEEGIDWATVIVGVCERDCQAPGVGVGVGEGESESGGAGYLEEWAGVQWEELSSGGRR